MNRQPSDAHQSEAYLSEVIERAWEEVCSAYDVQADTPAWENLFQNVDLSTPEEAAETVVTNMLLDVISLVDRFSPYYTQPASEFGLVSVLDCELGCHQWMLTVDTYIRWLVPIQRLRKAISSNIGLIQGLMLVERLMQDQENDPCIVARCGCSPPRFIKIRQSILAEAKIICDACLKPFAC